MLEPLKVTNEHVSINVLRRHCGMIYGIPIPNSRTPTLTFTSHELESFTFNLSSSLH